MQAISTQLLLAKYDISLMWTVISLYCGILSFVIVEVLAWSKPLDNQRNIYSIISKYINICNIIQKITKIFNFFSYN